MLQLSRNRYYRIYRKENKMKIFNAIKEQMMKLKARRIQKALIKTDDDKFIVESLPASEDNSAIDIHKVIKNIDNPETRAEVVQNNLEELIEQDHVKDAMRYLDDNDVLRILNENNKKLESNEKIKSAIEAIESNDKKLKAVVKNLESLNDCELGKILETLKPEKDETRQEEIEERKMCIITKRILRHMINNGSAWHFKELTETLKESSKLTIVKRCLITIQEYQKDNDVMKHITSYAKIKLVLDMFRLTQVSNVKKKEVLEDIADKGTLSAEEIRAIENDMEQEETKKEQQLTQEEH